MKQIKFQPTIFVIYGATGDLCWRKLVPALYNLFLDKWMPEKFAIIGTSRTAISNEDFREKLLDGVNQFSRSGKVTSEQWAVFSENIFYESADVNNYETYAGICQRVRGHEQEWNSQPYIIHYLAVAPNLFPVIAGNIAKSKLAEGKDHTRIVIEKPFGRDLESAKALNNLLNEYFKEDLIISGVNFLTAWSTSAFRI